MQYAIELYYDKETEQKLFDLANRVGMVLSEQLGATLYISACRGR